MGFKIEDADKPSVEPKQLVRLYKPVPMLPREEALRMRRAARNMADAMLPWAIQSMIELAESTENEELKFKILERIQKISLAGKSNEEVDPDAPTVDGQIVNDVLAKLEKETEITGDGEE